MATRYRDLQSPTLIQTGQSDSSAAQLSQQLANTFKDFENTSLKFGGILRAQTGEAAGMAEGAAGAPKPRSGLAAATPFGRAYNNAAEITYSNKVQVDLATRLNEIEQEAGTDLAKYDALAKASVEGTLKDAPPEWQVQVGQLVQPQVVSSRMRVAKLAHLKELDDADASYLEWAQPAIEQYAKDSVDMTPEEADASLAALVAKNEEQLAFLHEKGAIDAVERVKRKQTFVDVLDAAIADSHINAKVDDLMAVDTVNASKGDQAAAAMLADETIPQEEKDKIYQLFHQRRAALMDASAGKYLAETTALSKALAAGQSGLDGRAKWLYDRHALSREQYQGAVDQSTNNGQVAAGVGDAISYVQGKLDSGTGLDPGSSDDRKAAEAYFTAAVKNYTPGDDNWRATAEAFVKRGNILPESAQSWTRVAAMNPLTAAQAADFAARIREAKPEADAWNGEPKLDVYLTMVKDGMDNGGDPATVTANAHEVVYDMSPGVKEVRAADQKEYLKENPLTKDAIAKSMGVDDADLLSDDARASYTAEFNKAFALSGKPDIAHKVAAQKMRVYGIDTINGKPEMVRFPLSNKGFHDDVLRHDLTQSLAPLGIDGKNVRLVHIPATDRTRGMVWGLGTTDEFGNPEILQDDKNQRLVWTPPIGVDYTRRAAEVAAAKIASVDTADKLAEVITEFQATHPRPVAGAVR